MSKEIIGFRLKKQYPGLLSHAKEGELMTTSFKKYGEKLYANISESELLKWPEFWEPVYEKGVNLKDMVELAHNQDSATFDYVHDCEVIRLMRNACKMVLKLAAENASLITTGTPHPKGYPYLMVNPNVNHDPDEAYFVCDKQSILDCINLVE